MAFSICYFCQHITSWYYKVLVNFCISPAQIMPHRIDRSLGGFSTKSISCCHNECPNILQFFLTTGKILNSLILKIVALKSIFAFFLDSIVLDSEWKFPHIVRSSQVFISLASMPSFDNLICLLHIWWLAYIIMAWILFFLSAGFSKSILLFVMYFVIFLVSSWLPYDCGMPRHLYMLHLQFPLIPLFIIIKPEFSTPNEIRMSSLQIPQVISECHGRFQHISPKQ